VKRHGPTLLVLALLLATALAFVVSERVKLEKSPILGPEVDPVFSPVCECPDRVATISFRLSRADRLGVGIVDARDQLVRTLVTRKSFLPLHRLEFDWDGRDDEGRIVPEGVYRPRVRFADRDRTIILPNPIRVDETPPSILVESVRPRIFSPDGDGRAEGIAVRYVVNEPARALLLVDDLRRVRGKLRVRPKGQVQWYGRSGGRSFPAGTYSLALVAEDEAGNISAPVSAGTVRVRYIELGRRIVRSRARSRFSIRVDTDARAYVWRFAGRRGLASGPRLVLRARRRGRFALVVEERGHRARAVVVVAPRPRPARKAAGSVPASPVQRS
jgi:hypothetical protein